MSDPPSQVPSADPPSRKALSRGLSEFLIELSIGVNRYAMYPPGHPSLAPAVEGIVQRLGQLFSDRRTLSIGVARRQLVIEGVATEEKHPVLSELARRLHDLQLGAISFQAGVRGEEVLGLLATLGREPEPEDTPIGLLPPDEIPSWPHVQLHPLGYERLAIRDAEPPGARADRATQLWLGLAQAALAGAEPEDGETDARAVAESIEGHRREVAYDQVIVGYMLQLAEALKSEKGVEAERVRQRLATLVREMDETTLARLVELGGDVRARKQFVLDANQSLAVDAVVRVLQAAATASRETVSSSMTRLLTKLALHAEDGSGRLRTQARDTLRENVEALLADWELDDPNPEAYTRMLDRISRASPLFHRGEGPSGPGGAVPEDDGQGEAPPGSLRVLQMALEVGAYGPTVRDCILDLADLGRVGAMIRLAREVGPENPVGDAVLRELTAPDQVRRYLDLPDVDEDVLRAMADFVGPAIIPLLLEGLARSESRAVRRKVFDVTREMGPEIGEQVVARLQGEERWYVIRNLLALLEFAPEAASGVDLVGFLQNEDARVRREALPLALGDVGQRDRGLVLGLADPDEQVARAAVGALRRPLPDALVPTVVKRVLQADRGPGVKATAIRALAGSRAPLVRDALVALTTEGRTLLGKVKIAEVDPAVLAALEVLAEGWADDPEVATILSQAARSKDPRLRNSAEGGAR
ncbi:MAG: hypothetical protein P8188_01100 [Gemmatimonadota bacterium]